LVPNKEWSGGRVFKGPGEYAGPNLTPNHLGNWTDGEIIRAFTEGVRKDGSAIFPAMPYLHYGKMDRKDVNAIVAYLRSLPSISGDVPAPHYGFPMSILVNKIPRKASFEDAPAAGNTPAYGKYLVNIATCIECHTMRGSFGKLAEGMEFAGGEKFELPTGGKIITPNLTPDNETGIGTWTKEAFIARFKGYATKESREIPAQANAYNSTMPWFQFSGMTEQDLGAIYTYLHSLQPVKHRVERFVPDDAK
jgi:hypothetical protein